MTWCCKSDTKKCYHVTCNTQENFKSVVKYLLSGRIDINIESYDDLNTIIVSSTERDMDNLVNVCKYEIDKVRLV